MKINERSLANFATSSGPVDKQGWLWKKGELNTSYQKRWCVLRGNLLYYFEKSSDKDPVGAIILENCTTELAVGGDSSFTFSIMFLGNGMRAYKFVADNEEDLNEWIKCLSLSSYKYLKILVEDLEKTKLAPVCRDESVLVQDSQKPAILPALHNIASADDITKSKGKLMRKPLSNSNSEKNLAKLIDIDEKPLKIISRGPDGGKSKTYYYPLKCDSDTLIKVEYGAKGLMKNQVFITTDKSDVPTFSSASRPFSVMHECFRQCIEDCLTEFDPANETSC